MSNLVKRENELRVQEVNHLRNGKGTAKIHHIIEGDELKNKGKMFSKIVLPKGASIGIHDHTEDFEVYYILKGKGLVDEGDKKIIVNVADSVYTADGKQHSIENIGESDLEMIAVVIYA